MKTSKLVLKSVLVLLMVVQVGWSQLDNTQTITKSGTTAAQFLKIGVDARSAAMGNAYVAMEGDASSIFWNPAGIANVKGVEFLFNNSDWLAGTSFNYIGLVINAQRFGSLGLAVTQLGVPESEVTTVYEPEGTNEYWDASDFAISLAYGRRLSDRFSIGGNIKLIQQRLWHMSASTVAADIGALFVTPFNGIRLGATISNYGGDMQLSGRDILFSNDPDPQNEGNVNTVNAQYETEKYPLPLMFRVGLSGELLETDQMRLSFGLDAIHPNDNTEAVNVGLEYGFAETFFIRGGYANLFREDSEEGLTLGGGIHYRLWGSSTILKIDYSYTDFTDLGGVPRVTIGVRF